MVPTGRSDAGSVIDDPWRTQAHGQGAGENTEKDLDGNIRGMIREIVNDRIDKVEDRLDNVSRRLENVENNAKQKKMMKKIRTTMMTTLTTTVRQRAMNITSSVDGAAPCRRLKFVEDVRQRWRWLRWPSHKRQ